MDGKHIRDVPNLDGSGGRPKSPRFDVTNSTLQHQQELQQRCTEKHVDPERRKTDPPRSKNPRNERKSKTVFLGPIKGYIENASGADVTAYREYSSYEYNNFGQHASGASTLNVYNPPSPGQVSLGAYRSVENSRSENNPDTQRPIGDSWLDQTLTSEPVDDTGEDLPPRVDSPLPFTEPTSDSPSPRKKQSDRSSHSLDREIGNKITRISQEVGSLLEKPLNSLTSEQKNWINTHLGNIMSELKEINASIKPKPHNEDKSNK